MWPRLQETSAPWTEAIRPGTRAQQLGAPWLCPERSVRHAACPPGLRFPYAGPNAPDLRPELRAWQWSPRAPRGLRRDCQFSTSHRSSRPGAAAWLWHGNPRGEAHAPLCSGGAPCTFLLPCDLSRAAFVTHPSTADNRAFPGPRLAQRCLYQKVGSTPRAEYGSLRETRSLGPSERTLPVNDLRRLPAPSPACQGTPGAQRGCGRRGTTPAQYL